MKLYIIRILKSELELSKKNQELLLISWLYKKIIYTYFNIYFFLYNLCLLRYELKKYIIIPEEIVNLKNNYYKYIYINIYIFDNYLIKDQ